MPRYYTHVLSGADLVRDDEGQDFDCLEEARQLALKAAADMVADEISRGHFWADLELYIDDERGACLLTIPVAARVSGCE